MLENSSSSIVWWVLCLWETVWLCCYEVLLPKVGGKSKLIGKEFPCYSLNNCIDCVLNIFRYSWTRSIAKGLPSSPDTVTLSTKVSAEGPMCIKKTVHRIQIKIVWVCSWRQPVAWGRGLMIRVSEQNFHPAELSALLTPPPHLLWSRCIAAPGVGGCWGQEGTQCPQHGYREILH